MDQLDQMTEWVKTFCEDRDWDQFHGPKDLAIGLVTESSELLEEFRFLSENQVREKMENALARAGIEDELADITFFLLRFCQLNSIDLKSALKNKIQKNHEKYPVEKSRSKNLKYDKL